LLRFLLNDLPSAIREYDRAITIKPDFITAYLHKAGTYNSMGKFDLAEKTLRRPAVDGILAKCAG